MFMKLTETTLKRLRREGTDNPRGRKVYDASKSGFGCTVYATGKIVFWCRYGPRNRRRWTRCGTWGEVTVAQAKEKAKEILAQADLGGDPVYEAKRKRKVPTFRDWVQQYMGEVRHRRKRPAEIQRYLDRAVERWGGTPLDEISKADVRAAARAQLEEVRAKLEATEANRAAKEEREPEPLPNTAGHSTANRFLATVAACFNAAVDDELIPANPAARIKPYPEAEPRRRVLSDDEMARALKAISAEPDPFARAALLLLIATGARRSEVLNARWVDIDLEQGLWTIPTTKAGRKQVLPLSNDALAVLSGLERTTGPFVIAGRFPDRPRADLKKPWERVRKAAGIADVRIHDIRRSFGLRIARTAGLHVASKLLRHHSVTQTERVYAPLGLDDLREALQKANEAQPANVVDIAKARSAK